MGDELRLNGYEGLRGKRLKSFKLTVKEQFDADIGVAIKTQQLGIFDFRAFLNIAMLLTETANSADYIKKMRKRDAELAKGWGQIVTPLWLETSGHSPEKTETVE